MTWHKVQPEQEPETGASFEMPTAIPVRQRPSRYSVGAGHALLGRLFLAGVDADVLDQVGEMTKRMRFGVSSEAMVRHAIYQDELSWDEFPHDWDDLERCEIAHAIAPPWLADRMTPTLEAFRLRVRERMTSINPPPMFWSPRLPVEIHRVG